MVDRGVVELVDVGVSFSDVAAKWGVLWSFECFGEDGTVVAVVFGAVFVVLDLLGSWEG